MYLKALIVILALGVTFTISAGFYSPMVPAINVAKGRADFGKYCARCHSLAANKTNYGPSLNGIVDIASRRVAGQTAEEYLWRSLVFPQEFAAGEGAMPANLATELGLDRSRDIVAFLIHNHPKRNYSNLLEVTESLAIPIVENATLQLNLTDIEAGKDLFFGKHKCATCHKLNPVHTQDHLAAPSLEGVGLNDDQYLIESIRQPATKIVPGYQLATVRHFDNVHTGRLVFSSDARVTLLVGAEKAWRPITFELTGPDADEEFALQISQTPIMPAYDETALSNDELQKLLAFLKSLR